MTHAISNVAALESQRDRADASAQVIDWAQSRRDFSAEEIIDGFNWKDARDALELAAKEKPGAFEALCESLAHLQHIPNSQIEDRRIRDLSLALDTIAQYYAGHRAAQEVA